MQFEIDNRSVGAEMTVPATCPFGGPLVALVQRRGRPNWASGFGEGFENFDYEMVQRVKVFPIPTNRAL